MKDMQSGKAVEEWMTWSMTPHTEEEIEERLRRAPDSCCVSYICRYSNLSEPFIERMMALTTGLIDENTSEEEIKRIQEIVMEKLSTPAKELKHRTPKYYIFKIGGNEVAKTDIDINDRLDWFYISKFQILSPNFIMKYIDLIKIEQLHFERYSKQFRNMLIDYHKNNRKVKNNDNNDEE